MRVLVWWALLQQSEHRPWKKGQKRRRSCTLLQFVWDSKEEEKERVTID
jgi:hypothetical protein